MTRKRSSGIAVAAALTVNAVLASGTAHAVSVPAHDLPNLAVDSSRPLGSSICERGISIPGGHDAAAQSTGATAEPVAIAVPHFRFQGLGRNRNTTKAADSFVAETFDAPDSVANGPGPVTSLLVAGKLADVPLPPAVLLLGSAIFGLVTVARRKDG